MRDIPADILHSAYQAADASGIEANRDVLAIVIAQVAAAERDRALAHVKRAKTEIRKTGDGAVTTVRRAAISLVDAAAKAISSGAAA